MVVAKCPGATQDLWGSEACEGAGQREGVVCHPSAFPPRAPIALVTHWLSAPDRP